MARALSRAARRGAHRARALDVGVRRRGHRAAARLRRHATTTGRADRRSRGCAASACRRSCSTRRNDPFIPAASLPVRGEVERARARSSSRRTAATSASSTGPFPGTHRLAAAALAYHSSVRGDAERRVSACFRPTSPCNSPAEIFKAYDIRGIVGKTLTAPIVARDRPGARHARARARPRHDRRSAATAACRAPSFAAALADGIRSRRRGRDRRRHGGDADDLLRRASSRHRMQRDGHRQPQPARLQRPQDGGRRQHAVRRRHPGRCARASKRGRLATGAGSYRTHDIARRLHRAHRRRRQARAADEDRRRLRQRRRRRVRAGALPRAWAATSSSCSARSTATFPITIPTRRSPKNLADLIARLHARRLRARPRVRRRRRPPRRGHARRATSSIPTAS